jgi:hypothetical protein
MATADKRVPTFWRGSRPYVGSGQIQYMNKVLRWGHPCVASSRKIASMLNLLRSLRADIAS